jgi:hypothetical protein
MRNAGKYQDVPVTVACGFDDFLNPVDLASLPEGQSIALVLGERDSIEASILIAVADAVAMLKPALVHCFGRNSLAMHDAIDRALWKRGQEGVVTYWEDGCEPDEVIFEFFVTDFPAEFDVDRWSGRLLIIDEIVPRTTVESILLDLQDIHAAVQRCLRAPEA